MRRAITTCLLLLFGVPDSSMMVHAQSERIRIAVDETYPPYMYDEGAHGLYPTLMREIFARIRVEVEITGYPWKRALLLGERGEEAVGGIYKNEKRLLIYDYSDPLFEEKLVVFVRKGEMFKFDELSDLRGKRVGINRGWSYGQEFDEAREAKVFEAKEAEDNHANFGKLVRGRIDCLIADELSALQILHRENLQSVVDRLARPAAVNKAYLVFARESGRRELLDRFNTAVGAMREDGSYNRIVDTFVRALQDDIE